MKKHYEYIIITVTDSSLRIECTNTSTLEYMDKTLTANKFTVQRNETNRQRFIVENMNRRQWDWAWYFVAELCHDGWEPFTGTFTSEYSVTKNIYQLRKEIIEEPD